MNDNNDEKEKNKKGSNNKKMCNKVIITKSYIYNKITIQILI